MYLDFRAIAITLRLKTIMTPWQRFLFAKEFSKDSGMIGSHHAKPP